MHKVWLSLKNAWSGLVYCFRTQRNMLIHAVIGALILAAALILRISLVGMLLLITAIVAVIVTEVINTALEQAIDLFSRERSQLAHNAKDIAAGAVLLASAFAVVIGLCILGPPLWSIFRALFLLR